MSTNPTLTVSVNGGPPQTGAIYFDDGDTLDLGALNRSGWLRARYEMTDYPEGFPCPSGWSTAADDAIRPTYYCDGMSDPPTVTSSGWGVYKTRVIVNDVDVDERTFGKVLSPSGFEAQAAGEEGQFGGTKLQKDKAYNANLQLIEDYSAALAIADVAPTPDTIAKRGPSGEGKFTAVESPSIASLTTSFSALNSAGRGLTVNGTTTTLLFGSCTVALDASNCAVSAPAAIGLTAGSTITAAATTSVSVTSGTTCTVTASGLLTLSGGAGAALKTTVGGIDLNPKTGVVNLQKDSATGLVFTVNPTGAVTVAPVAGATSVTYQQSAAASGVGAATVYGAQAGFAGSIGGYTQVGVNNGGTPGTNLAGGVRAELGTLVANQSAKLSLRANGTEFAYLRQQGASSETILSSLGALDLDSATSTVNLMANGSASVVWTLSASGAVTLAPVGGAASLTIQPSQKTSGAGATAAFAGGQGSSGNVGGKTTVGADNGATPGTNLGGGVRVQLGQRVSSISSALDVYAGATEIVAINSNASYLYQQKTTGGGAGYQAQSGVIIGSNDDTVRVDCSQAIGVVTVMGTNGGVRLQDTSVTWCEVARVAVGRNVVGLAVGANLDTTKMPSNTGNGVVFLGNASTAPTADPNSTGAILWCETQQVRYKANTEYAELSPLLSNTGGTASSAVVHNKRDYTLTTTATTANQVIGALTLLSTKGVARIRVSYTGYDTSGDAAVYAERLYRVQNVSGTLTIATDTIGTDSLSGGSVSAAASGAAIQFRVTPGSSANTRWCAHVDAAANYIT